MSKNQENKCICTKCKYGHVYEYIDYIGDTYINKYCSVSGKTKRLPIGTITICNKIENK